MSSEPAPSTGGSRPPQSNSALDSSGSVPVVSVSDERPDLDELPDPSERVREFVDRLGERAHLPMSDVHGRTMRRDCCDEEWRSYTVEDSSGSTEKREERVNVTAKPLYQVVSDMLHWHEDYLRSTLRLEYGERADPEHKLLDVPLDNSWMIQYQKKERARLKAMERETAGYRTCDECDTRYCTEQDEHSTEYVFGEFDDPYVVLTGRTAAGDGAPPVDHARSIAEAWTGEHGNDGAGRSLRYVMSEKLGLESDEWVRWTQGEPHTGKRRQAGGYGNLGYHHAHDVIVLDGAAASVEPTAATFRTVIEKHVEECAGAGREAHDLDKSAEEWKNGDVDTVEVKNVKDDIEESVASYAAAYLANEEKDLLERSVPYLMWAATMWASNSQKGVKSVSANRAIEVDRCKHKHENGDQTLEHGEMTHCEDCRCVSAPGTAGCSRCDDRGFHVVCTACGSQWGIDQSSPAVSGNDPRVAADGGSDDPSPEQKREEALRDRWPSARRAASVGGDTVPRECSHDEPDTCPLCATETESPNHTVSGDVPIPETAAAPDVPDSVSVRYTRPPSWSAKEVRRDHEDDPLPATGGGVETLDLDLPSAPVRVAAMATDSLGEMVCQSCKVTFTTVSEYAEHGCSDGRVHVAYRGATVRNPECSCPRCGYTWRADRRADGSECPVCAAVRDRCDWVDEPVPVVPVGDGDRVGAPAAETTLLRDEFLGVVPDRLLEKGTDATAAGEPTEGTDGERADAAADVSDRLRRYVDEHAISSVAEVLGKFGLPPSARSDVADLL
ncbi:ORF1 [Haloarcula hispanica pleomorphic virus 1]|uniref:ORF1 n=1 Tax=Haloarcula hispanica pleomorphic virus 1 TaxID=710112 RepID=D3JVB8_9VIRU|nr:replication protein [Haloarcula hispanica pleomorphic virus 1]ADB79717.1 ORF1 [Haloarcula hispanica pleomorphic virus 1]